MAALGYALSLAERPRDGVKLIEDAIAALEGYGQRVWYALMLAQLGEAHVLGGNAGRGGECATRALVVARERGERGFEAAALRLLGAVALRAASPEVDAACEHYRAALRLAEERAMQPLIAHCNAGLAVVATRFGDLGAADAHRTKAREIRRTIGIATPSALEPDEPSGV